MINTLINTLNAMSIFFIFLLFSFFCFMFFYTFILLFYHLFKSNLSENKILNFDSIFLLFSLLFFPVPLSQFPLFLYQAISICCYKQHLSNPDFHLLFFRIFLFLLLLILSYRRNIWKILLKYCHFEIL